MKSLPIIPISSPIVALMTIRPATCHDIGDILQLHSEAFADKFGGVFGSNRTPLGVAALRTAWQRQGNRALLGMKVAELEGRIIGTTTLRTADMEHDDMWSTEQAFQQVLGMWVTLRSIFALSLLSHRVQPHEGFITDVAVLPAYRRHGVATTLLAYAEEEARLSAKQYLSLYVSRSNAEATRLYEKLGFRAIRTRHSSLTWLMFGQREWIYMGKDLTDEPERSEPTLPSHS